MVFARKEQMATTDNTLYILTEEGMFLEDFITLTMQGLEKHNIKDVGFEVKLRGGHKISFGIKVKKGKK